MPTESQTFITKVPIEIILTTIGPGFNKEQAIKLFVKSKFVGKSYYEVKNA